MTPRTNTLFRVYVDTAINASKIIGRDAAANMLVALGVPYHVIYRVFYDHNQTHPT